MMASPRLALIFIPLNIPILIGESSLAPSYALNSIITVLYIHHNLSISDLSFCSCKPGYMLFLKLFDTVLKIHSSLQTLTHNLTPPSLQKLPLNIPVISHCIQIPPQFVLSYIHSGPPSENPGPWAERSRALSYRAVTGPYYVDNVDIRGPAGPCRALPGPAGPLKVAGPLGFCPPPAPPLGGPVYIPLETHQPVKRRGQIMPLKKGLNTALGYNHQSTCMPQLGTILLIIIVNYCVIILNYFQL